MNSQQKTAIAKQRNARIKYLKNVGIYDQTRDLVDQWKSFLKTIRSRREAAKLCGCSPAIITNECLRLGVPLPTIIRGGKRGHYKKDQAGCANSCMQTAPLKYTHRLDYCYGDGKTCIKYYDCLTHHVEVLRRDDKPFRRYIESKGTCYTTR